MTKNWNEIAKNAGEATDEHFSNKISSLTRLNDQEINDLITETGISEADLVHVLEEIKEATKSNQQKAEAIKKISKGVDVLVGMAGKLI